MVKINVLQVYLDRPLKQNENKCQKKIPCEDLHTSSPFWTTNSGPWVEKFLGGQR